MDIDYLHCNYKPLAVSFLNHNAALHQEFNPPILNSKASYMLRGF